MTKKWTVKLEVLIQHVAFEEVDADTAEEAVRKALASDDLNFEPECDACPPYVYSVADEDGVGVECEMGRNAGHKLGQVARGDGLESLPEGALNAMHQALILEGAMPEEAGSGGTRRTVL